MKNPGLLIVFLFFIILPCPVIAFQCLSENDCPKCSIDGAMVTKKSLNTGYTDKQILTCEYSSSDENVGKVTLAITCLENAGIARQWTDYYAGTGENPDKSQYAGLSGRPRWRCVSGGSSKGSGQTMIKTFGCGDFTGTDRFVAMMDADGQATYLSSDPSAGESRKLSAAQDVVKARIQKYKDCFAGFSPGAAPSPLGKSLHGTIIATRLPYGIEYPLKHAKLALYDTSQGTGRSLLGETTTDNEGAYEFKGLLEKGKTYDLDINLTYYDEKEYFSLYMGTAESESKVILPDSFTCVDDKDLERNINLDELWTDTGLGGENPMGIVYAHTAEALEYYQDRLKEDIHLNLPLKVVAFVPDATFRKDIKAVYYFNKDTGHSAIAIGHEESGPRSEFSPINREYHEFSHYMMTNTYGRFLGSRVKSEIAIINHDGYINPSTSDSWQEGFATFMSVLIAEDNGYSCDGTGGFVNLDSSHKAWDYQGKAEEFAVAGVLYDLYDGNAQTKACLEKNAYLFGRMANSPYLTDDLREMASFTFNKLTEETDVPESWELYPDDDGISLSLQEMWAVLKNNHPDFTSVYHGFIEQYPGKKTEIDTVFLDHGFFIDKDPGNGHYDPKEPFRDANGNSAYDTGELYIDLAAGDSNENKPVFDRLTDTVGTAADNDRPWRLSTQQLPGHFIKVNNAVPFYGYVVDFPGTARPSYSVLVRNDDGLIYVQVPPESGAKITVTPIGVKSGNPLIFTSDQFNGNYMTAVRQGYYTSHDFQISGPVPTPPVTPDFNKGSLAKKGTGLPDFLSPASRIPLTLSVPVAIIGLVVLAYLLKKGL